MKIKQFIQWYEGETGDTVTTKDKENLEDFEQTINENPKITPSVYFIKNPMTFAEASLIYEYWIWLVGNE